MRNWIGILLGAAALATAANAASGPFRLSPKEYIPVSEVRPGMTGYGLTVFKGTKIERFGVKVLAVMPQYNSGEPVVLVMMSGGPITLRHANIIAGMSGSPVYIKGRLLGAVALGDSNPREPMGMVVPIENMVDALDPRLPTKPSFAAAPPASSDKWASLMPSASSLPLFASGFGARGLSQLNTALAPMGLHAMAGPAGGGKGVVPPYFPKGVKLEPGSAIAVSLMQGDVDLTAIGTVTYRKGDGILAFGHPFLQYGAAEYPASTAYIHDVFSSSVRSYKMGTLIETVGAITQDRPFSVGGFVHRMPHMTPMTVHVSDSTSGRRHDFHVRMVNHPMLLPTLIPMAAAELIDRVRPYPGDSMGTVKVTVESEGYAPITRTNRFFDPSYMSGSGLSDLLSTLSILSRNPFEPVRIKGVEMWVDINSGHSTASVERAWIEKDKVEPGDTITVQAVVKPYKQPAEVRALQVKVPENAPIGPAQVVVFGGATGFGMLTTGSAPAGAGPTSATSVSTVKQLIARYLEREKNDELGVRVLLPGSAVTVDGQRFSGLPDPLADVMKSTKASSTRLERDELRAKVSTPWVIAGTQMLTVNIERKARLEKSGAATTPSAATTVTTTVATPSSADSDAVSTGDDDASSLQPALMTFAAPAKNAKKKDAPAAVTAPTSTPAATAEAKPADAKPAETKPEEADPNKDAKGPGRLATVWKQASKIQFETGKLTGVTVTSNGDVEATRKLVPVVETTRPYVWSVLPNPDGSALLGTGNRGEILKVGADSKAAVFADTGELEVHAMVRGKDGVVYAGTSPNGRILKVSPAGKAAPFFETGEKFVLALTMDATGNLYAATGPNAKVFRISPDGAGSALATFPEANVLSLAVAKDGSVLAGTAPDGIVYSIAPDGKASVRFDSPEANVTAVAVNASGDLFVATAPNGKVYRVYPDGRSETLLEKPDGNVLALQAAADGALYAAGGKRVYRITSDKTVTYLDNDDQNQLVSLAVAADGGLYAGSANTGALYRAQAEKTGSYESAVHDAELRATWGRMEWSADANGGKVEVQTRTGNVAQPDTTWSAWSPAVSDGGSAQVTSPAARYIQYRATLTPAADGKSPSLRWLSVRYLPDNRPPTVKLTDPKEGDRFAGKKTVKWTGTDPDSDLLNYTLYLSADNGATWNPLNTAAPEVKKEEPKPDAKPVDAEKAKKDADTLKQVADELDRYNLSPEMKTAVKGLASAALSGAKDEAGASDKGDNLNKSSYVWDTNTAKDGLYRLKVVATDKPGNPDNALSDEDELGPVLICNAKPTVSVFDRNTVVAADKTVTLQGESVSPLAAIVRVSYRVDKGQWLAASAQDGIFDSPRERWRIATDALPKGDHAIEVKATDEVDNSGTATAKVTIP
ncbi:MAG TPA: hypothetical protein VGM37_21290 [Armatimonadota bacterium]|jgi:hypothetical protein